MVVSVADVNSIGGGENELDVNIGVFADVFVEAEVGLDFVRDDHGGASLILAVNFAFGLEVQADGANDLVSCGLKNGVHRSFGKILEEDLVPLGGSLQMGDLRWRRLRWQSIRG
jgi:hypothetical protein